MAGGGGCRLHGRTAARDCAGCEPTRRHDAWGQWVARLREWHLCATLTVDPRRRLTVPPGAQRSAGAGRLRWPVRLTETGISLGAPMAGDVARRRVMTWLRHGEQLLGRPVAAVVAMEHHKNGWPHFHGLLGLDGGLRGREIAALGRLWFERNGYSELEVPRDVGAAASYASKYLTKELDTGGVLIHPAHGPLRGLQTAFGAR
jgi:hypothetical protein